MYLYYNYLHFKTYLLAILMRSGSSSFWQRASGEYPITPILWSRQYCTMSSFLQNGCNSIWLTDGGGKPAALSPSRCWTPKFDTPTDLFTGSNTKGPWTIFASNTGKIITWAIHSFITQIYIAPLQGYNSEALPILARLRRTVFRLQ